MESAGHLGGTRGLGIVSSSADKLVMSGVRGMGGVGGVREICMCLALGGVGGEGGEWMGGLGLNFSNIVGTGVVLVVSLCLGCGGVGVGGVDGEWVGGLDQGLEGWGFVMSV